MFTKGVGNDNTVTKVGQNCSVGYSKQLLARSNPKDDNIARRNAELYWCARDDHGTIAEEDKGAAFYGVVRSNSECPFPSFAVCF